MPGISQLVDHRACWGASRTICHAVADLFVAKRGPCGCLGTASGGNARDGNCYHRRLRNESISSSECESNALASGLGGDRCRWQFTWLVRSVHSTERQFILEVIVKLCPRIYYENFPWGEQEALDATQLTSDVDVLREERRQNLGVAPLGMSHRTTLLECRHRQRLPLRGEWTSIQKESLVRICTPEADPETNRTWTDKNARRESS